MRLLFIFLITSIFISCGEQPVTGTDVVKTQIDSLVTFEEEDNLSDSEKTMLMNVCSALGSKEEFFNKTIVNKGKLLQFRLQEKACDGNIQNDSNFSSELELTRFGIGISEAIAGSFSEIITPDSAMIQDFCSLSTASIDIQRAQRNTQFATWLNLIEGGSGLCSDRKDQVCIVISSGILDRGNDTYRISDVEVLKVRSNKGRSYGVVTERALYSNDSCRDKKQSEATIQASLSF